MGNRHGRKWELNMILHVMYKTMDGKRDSFIKEINDTDILDLIRKEDGCISYNYYLDSNDENVILLVEEWENKEKQKIHLKQDHMKKLGEIKNKYVLDTKVREF